MEIFIGLLVAIVILLVTAVIKQRSQPKELTDEELKIVSVPYGPGSKRDVFLYEHQVAWWESLSQKQRRSHWDMIQDAVKNGNAEKIYNEKGRVIGYKPVSDE